MSIAQANLHAGRRNLGPFPPAAPSNPDAPHVTSAEILIDAADDQGPLTRVWESIGYDEINWTYTPTGKRLLKTFQEFSGHSYYVRPHYVFCSGSGFGIPHWGSGNVYHEDDDGNPYYDFTIADQAYDAIVNAGHHVLVELGVHPARSGAARGRTPSLREQPHHLHRYEAGTWAYPPRDYDKWGGLIEALRPALRRALRRGGSVQLALGAVERAGHLLLARHPGAVQRALHGDGPGDPSRAAQRQGRWPDGHQRRPGVHEAASWSTRPRATSRWTSSPSTPRARRFPTRRVTGRSAPRPRSS